MIKTRKIEKIIVDKSKICKLMDSFDCGMATVYNALAFKSNSETAQKIRDKAINQYGGIKNVFKIPVA